MATHDKNLMSGSYEALQRYAIVIVDTKICTVQAEKKQDDKS